MPNEITTTEPDCTVHVAYEMRLLSPSQPVVEFERFENLASTNLQVPMAEIDETREGSYDEEPAEASGSA